MLIKKEKPKYKLVKFNIGLLSILCGESFYIIHNDHSSIIAHADDTNIVNNQNENTTSDYNTNKAEVNSLITNPNANGMYNSNLNNDSFQTDPVTPKSSYHEGEDIPIYDQITNNTNEDQNLTTELALYDANNPVLFQTSKNYVKAHESINVDNNNNLKQTLTIPHDKLQNNHGYLAKINVYDNFNNLLSSKSLGISVEDNWKVFPRYGVIAGSGDYNNSIINNSNLLNKYNQQLQEMARMHINANFFYDVYKDPANPWPNDNKVFQQNWSWWSGKNGSTIDPTVVKQLVNLSHQYNQAAMLYNMISAKTNNENSANTPGLPDDSQLVYNFNNGSFGSKGEPMTNTMKTSDPYIAQIYYNPASPSWIKYIANTMASAMKNGGFDGWQGDTIGDSQVTTVENKNTNDPAKSFNMSDTYAYFTNQLKDYWKTNNQNYDFTLNAVGGNGLINLAKSKEDVAYVEVWPGISYDGYNTSEYGDLKWMVDKVRQASGKSLIVAAYLKNNQFINGKFNDDAQLLVDATIAAAGGYHMTIAANANNKDNNHIGVLDNEYYPNQEAGVSDNLNHQLYNYQQFITAYENILRGKDVENDDNIAKVFNTEGKQLSKDDNSSRASGRTGNQVWTFTKTGNDFKTIQLINLMGINSDWDNTSKNNNKTPIIQNNLTVTYPLNNTSYTQAQEMANNVYIMSPDNENTMQKAQAYINNKNGHYDLVIKVPQLKIWDMVYIKTNPAPSQLIHYQYVNNHNIISEGTTIIPIKNNMYDLTALNVPHNYKIINSTLPLDSTSMLLTIPLQKDNSTSSDSSSSTPSTSQSSSTSSSSTPNTNQSSSASNSFTPSTSQSSSTSSSSIPNTNQSSSTSNSSTPTTIQSSSASNSSTPNISQSSSASSSSTPSTSQSSNASSASTPTTSQSSSASSSATSNISQSSNHSKINPNNDVTNTGTSLNNKKLIVTSNVTPNTLAFSNLSSTITPNKITNNSDLAQTNINNNQKNDGLILTLITASSMFLSIGSKKKKY